MSHISKCNDYSCPVMLAQSFSLSDCQFVVAASFSMYEIYPSLHPLTRSLLFLLLLPCLPPSSIPLPLHPLLPQPICHFYILLCRHACPLFTSATSHLFQHSFHSFHPSFPVWSFLKILNYPVFCLTAPPPLSKPPLISLLASCADSLDLVPWPLSCSITHLAF